MRHVILIANLWFAVSVGLAQSAPARPLFVDDPPAKAPAPAVIVNLNNTAWLGKYNTIQRVFIFEADGTLSYRSPASKTKGFKNRGTWRIVRNTFHFEHWINPQTKLLEFKGTIVDADTIVGEQTMTQTGQKMNVTMQRAPLDPK
ncbi:MAG: hypothetical protein FJ303_25295 [Planctomycetes bacterium]|nr:hypothetical protein [Planctomycetota bacterium]